MFHPHELAEFRFRFFFTFFTYSPAVPPEVNKYRNRGNKLLNDLFMHREDQGHQFNAPRGHRYKKLIRRPPTHSVHHVHLPSILFFPPRRDGRETNPENEMHRSFSFQVSSSSFLSPILLLLVDPSNCVFLTCHPADAKNPPPPARIQNTARC